MVQGQPERVEGQGLRRLRRHLRLRRPRPRGLPAAVVPLRAVVRARHRGGRGARHGRGPLARREPLPARLRDGVHEPRRPRARRRAAHRRADDADVQPRNALRLPLLRAADVPRRHARAAERPLVDDVRRRAHPPRDRDLRPQPPRRRQRALQLPHAGYAGGGGLHALLPRHVPRLRDVPHGPRLAARAPPGDARHAQRPRALRARGRPRREPARLVVRGLGAAPRLGGRLGARLARRRRERRAEPLLPRRPAGRGAGGGRDGERAPRRALAREGRAAEARDRGGVLRRGARALRLRRGAHRLLRARAVPRAPHGRLRGRTRAGALRPARRDAGPLPDERLLLLLPLRGVLQVPPPGPLPQTPRPLEGLREARRLDVPGGARVPRPRLPQRLPRLGRASALVPPHGRGGHPQRRAVLRAREGGAAAGAAHVPARLLSAPVWEADCR